jgi:hypothetical protein
MEKVNYTFDDGLEITGTIDQITLIAKSLKRKLDASKFDSIPKGYYMSEMAGLIKLDEMNELHLRRALLKRAKAFYDEIPVNADDSIQTFLLKFTDLGLDPIVIDLFTELDRRITTPKQGSKFGQ